MLLKVLLVARATKPIVLTAAGGALVLPIWKTFDRRIVERGDLSLGEAMCPSAQMLLLPIHVPIYPFIQCNKLETCT